MKCYACGYEYDWEVGANPVSNPRFRELNVTVTEDGEDSEGYTRPFPVTLHACPKCGTMRAD